MVRAYKVGFGFVKVDPKPATPTQSNTFQSCNPRARIIPARLGVFGLIGFRV